MANCYHWSTFFEDKKMINHSIIEQMNKWVRKNLRNHQRYKYNIFFFINKVSNNTAWKQRKTKPLGCSTSFIPRWPSKINSPRHWTVESTNSIQSSTIAIHLRVSAKRYGLQSVQPTRENGEEKEEEETNWIWISSPFFAPVVEGGQSSHSSLNSILQATRNPLPHSPFLPSFSLSLSLSSLHPLFFCFPWQPKTPKAHHSSNHCGSL